MKERREKTEFAYGTCLDFGRNKEAVSKVFVVSFTVVSFLKKMSCIPTDKRILLLPKYVFIFNLGVIWNKTQGVKI